LNKNFFDNILNFNFCLNEIKLHFKAQNPLKKYQKSYANTDPTFIQAEIGGTREFYKHATIRREFSGNICGLVYNRFRIFDLLLQSDSRVKIFGDLRPLTDAEVLENELDPVSLFFLLLYLKG
jgi:hypothetical protein